MNNTFSYVPPPPRSLNGGLYTGQPFIQGAPWANIPVIPDAGYMTHINLRSARPPEDALYQHGGGIRPGNNYQTMPGVKKVSDAYNLWCSSAPCSTKLQNPCDCDKCKRAKYSYL